MVCLTIHTSHLTDGKKSRNIIFQENYYFFTIYQHKDFLGTNQDRSMDFIQQQHAKIFCIQVSQCFEGFLEVYHTCNSSLTGYNS